LAQTRIQTQSRVEDLKRQRSALEREIRADYERLTARASAAADHDQLAKLRDRIRGHEQRLGAIGEELTLAAGLIIDESDVRQALADFDQIWSVLKVLLFVIAIRLLAKDDPLCYLLR
jgi:DNA repair exonuclease SbcCD ATPase subunit